VFLTDDGEATLLKYEVNAQVGGKLAQLGARLIDATAKQMAEQFFTKFSDEVQKLVPVESAPTPVAAPVQVRPSPVAPPSSVGMLDMVPRDAFGLPLMGWVGIALFAGMVVLWLASML
jgi:capsular polysaccharide biosynthesis protein